MSHRRPIPLVVSTALCCLLVSPALVAQDEEEQPLEQAVQTGAFAITTLLPGGLNLSISALISDRWGIELSGGHWPATDYAKMAGLEGGIIYRLRQSPRHFSALFVNAGHSSFDYKDPRCKDDTWTYGAFGLIYKWRALYTEVGLSAGSGTFPNPQLIGQVGISLVTFKRR